MAAPAVTYTFANSTTADATQVNQNFTDIINGLSDGTKDLTINALTCGGSATLNGNVTLGNSTSDDVTFTGSLASTMNIKTTQSFDIGSSTIGLRSIYFGDASGTDGTTRVIGGNVGSSWTLTLPTGVPAASGYAFTATTGGVGSWADAKLLSVTSQDTGYSVQTTDNVVLGPLTNDRTFTLPTAAGATGKVYTIKKTDSSYANVITVATTSSQTIDGVTTTTLDTQYETLTVVSDGSNWHTLYRRIPSTWTAFTPTGSLSTNASYVGLMKRIGDSLHLKMEVTFSGTNTQSNPTFDIPNSLTIDTAKLMATSSGVDELGQVVFYDSSGSGQARLMGHVQYNDATTVIVTSLDDAAGTDHYTRQINPGSNVPVAIASGDKIKLDFIVPISGWKG